MRRISKSWGLKSAKKAKKHKKVAKIAILSAGRGFEPVFIDFSEDFVKFLGKLMPMGVSEALPVRLKVLKRPGKPETWDIYCSYIQFPATYRLVYRTNEVPKWLNLTKTQD